MRAVERVVRVVGRWEREVVWVAREVVRAVRGVVGGGEEEPGVDFGAELGVVEGGIGMGMRSLSMSRVSIFVGWLRKLVSGIEKGNQRGDGGCIGDASVVWKREGLFGVARRGGVYKYGGFGFVRMRGWVVARGWAVCRVMG